MSVHPAMARSEASGPGVPAGIATALVTLIIGGCVAAATHAPTSVPAGTGPTSSVSGSAAPESGVPTAATPSPPDAAVELVADGLDTPVGLVAYPGRQDTELIWEQTGTVRVLEGGRLLPGDFLDLRERVVALMPEYDERGLQSLAFHPSFGTNGRLFAYYAAPTRAGHDGDHTNRLSEFRVDPADPLRVVAGSERVILEFEQPQFNHSGGGLAFGPDGYLYLGTGDGGGEGDASEGHAAQGNAQAVSRLNGKVLRIDVDHPGAGGRAYAIPADNPFANGPVTARPEIFALGFRNPWRLSFEPDGQRRPLVSDVGYGRYEEIDTVVRGGNYGWRIREGAHCLDLEHPLADLAACAATGADGGPLIDPVVEYSHAQIGIAVVGGFVYEGSTLPALVGRYIFADFTRDWKGNVPTPRGTLMVADPQAIGAWPWRPLKLSDGLIPSFVTGIGRDAAGELYLLVRDTLGPSTGTGRVLRLVPAGA
jgi:glucose/arabinose dehydrogenase